MWPVSMCWEKPLQTCCVCLCLGFFFCVVFSIWTANSRKKKRLLLYPECAWRLLLLVALRIHARARTQFASGLVNIFPFRVDTSAFYLAEENAKDFLVCCNGDSEQSWGGDKLNDLRLWSNWSEGRWRCESCWSQGGPTSTPALPGERCWCRERCRQAASSRWPRASFYCWKTHAVSSPLDPLSE